MQCTLSLRLECVNHVCIVKMLYQNEAQAKGGMLYVGEIPFWQRHGHAVVNKLHGAVDARVYRSCLN